MSSGFDNGRPKEYLHVHRIDKHKCSRSSDISTSSSAESLDSCCCQRRSDVEVYGSRNNNSSKTNSNLERRRSYSGSESPPARHSRRSSRDSQRMRQSRSQQFPQASRCIGVFGLSTNTTQHKVRELFNKFGPIERIQMVIDAHTHRSRGFCFIYFENLGDARAAKDACTGMNVDGRRIRVDYSTTKRAHTPTPGVYMGRPSRQPSRRSRDRDNNFRHESRRRRRNRDYSSSLSPNDRSIRQGRNRNSRSYSRSRSPPKPRYQSRY